MSVVELPDFEHCFAAHLLLAGFFVGLDALRSREDERAVAVAHSGDFVHALVHAAARLGNALHAFDKRLAVGVVLDSDLECLLDLLPLLVDTRALPVPCFSAMLGVRTV